MIRDLVAEAAKSGVVRGDVSPDELANYCLHDGATAILPPKLLEPMLCAQDEDAAAGGVHRERDGQVPTVRLDSIQTMDRRAALRAWRQSRAASPSRSAAPSSCRVNASPFANTFRSGRESASPTMSKLSRPA